MNKSFDAIVIGGGVFGCHAAIFLAKQGKRIALIEQEDKLITRASIVNQARLHAGYHYPRSIATARSSDKFVERFGTEFAHCINRDFVHYYAIAQRGSLTEPRQFQAFCDYLGIPCVPLENHATFNYEQLSAVFSCREYSFDPHLLANEYRQRVNALQNIELLLGSRVGCAEKKDSQWKLVVDGCSLSAGMVVNATYSSINTINRQFGQQSIPLMHEIAEMAFVRTGEAFKDSALTIMDGPFCSLMPYGKSGLHSLSSVAYTHQRVSYDTEPNFPECQSLNPNCSPSATDDCSRCAHRPESNYGKMFSQLSRYLTSEVAKSLDYQHSRYTIKAKLRANHIDDGRPTEVRLMDTEAPFICLFAGKVNNVYAMEDVLVC